MNGARATGHEWISTSAFTGTNSTDEPIPDLPVIECLLEATVRDLYQMKRSGARADSMRVGSNSDYPRSLS